MYMKSILKSRKGAGMILGLFALLVLFAFGMSFLSVAASSVITAKRDYLRARALEVAEAGMERGLSYLRGTAPDGSTDGSWRTTHPSANPENHTGDTWYTETLATGESFQLCVRTAAGGDPDRIMLTCVSTVTHGSASASRTLKALIERRVENIAVWNNVIFGGVGQTGKSINGNVRMRGSVHLLGDGESYTDVDGDGRWDQTESYTDSNSNGQYDLGEPFTDTDGDGHRDTIEPFNDVNGNGTRDPALTVTDLAEEISGTADVGNNYNGMPVNLSSKIPAPPTGTVGGESVETLSAKLRVKHGRVDISGSATVGASNVTGDTTKETMDGAYVSDGYGGTKGSASVYSDNGAAHGYDLGDGIVTFPAMTDPYPGYASYQAYLAANSLQIGSDLTLSGTSYAASNAYGSISYNATTGLLQVSGIVYVNGDIQLYGKSKAMTYSGSGTLVSTEDIDVHCDVLPQTGFPVTDRLGMIAAHNMGIATGGGDSQLTMAVAAYAQYRITIGKQCEIAGSIVSSYFAMSNVPHIYQVPQLSDNLPPGMPGGDPIWIVTLSTLSWEDQAGAVN